MYNYFPHPSNARQSLGLASLIMMEGYAAYGLYWALIELLRDAHKYRYSSDIRVLKYVLHEADGELVERVCKQYGLFDFDDDGLIFSPWLCEQMGEYDTKKAKLSAAGKKGAAKRYAAAAGAAGQAIASPTLEAGQAIAYNITQPNITPPNITPPSKREGSEWSSILSNVGKQLEDDFVELMARTSPEVHNTGFVAQECKFYGVGENVFNFICESSNNADMTHPLFVKFRELVKRIHAEKWHPKQPNAFFIKKLFE